MQRYIFFTKKAKKVKKNCLFVFFFVILQPIQHELMNYAIIKATDKQK